MSTTRRMNRIFQPDGKALIVALDHGLLDGPCPGMEDPAETIAKIVAGGAMRSSPRTASLDGLPGSLRRWDLSSGATAPPPTWAKRVTGRVHRSSFLWKKPCVWGQMPWS